MSGKQEKKNSTPSSCRILSDVIYHFLLSGTREQESKSTLRWWLMYKYVRVHNGITAHGGKVLQMLHTKKKYSLYDMK